MTGRKLNVRASEREELIFAIGVAGGAIVPNQVGAVITLLAWGFVVENLVFGFLPKIGRFLPVHAEESMMGPIEDKLLAVVGVSLLRRRDVS